MWKLREESSQVMKFLGVDADGGLTRLDPTRDEAARELIDLHGLKHHVDLEADGHGSKVRRGFDALFVLDDSRS